MSKDVVIIGAGAAGLMTAAWAGQQKRESGRRVILLDGAKKLGAKILVAGGGRCNVTHHQVDAAAFAGGSRNAIKKILRRFDVAQTTDFFKQHGVQLKREETGKLFPVTDQARTVLDALLGAVTQAGGEILHPRRVSAVTQEKDGRFLIQGDWGQMRAEKIVLATGGKSIPKSGSDGYGYRLAQGLGHSLTEPIFPALVPLTLHKDHFLCQLRGITLPAQFDLWSSSQKRLQTFANSTLLTHFGLSGPAVLDMSRYYLAAKAADTQTTLTVNWIPRMTPEQFDQALLSLGKKQPISLLRAHLPERMARALLEQSGISDGPLTRVLRKKLVSLVTRYPLPLSGDRGYNYAEVTAGGVPLTEINLKTMESRICPNLFFAGEICNVDGRIGGFNFQWAWSSGYVAGISL